VDPILHCVDAADVRAKSVADFFEPAERGVQHASLRAANRRAVLTAITFNPGISNAEVSRRTGLAPQTASAIVAELEDDGLVVRGEVLRGRRGQPATPLYLDFSGGYGIGCEVSWRHIDVMLINLGSEEIAHHRRDYTWPDATTIVAEAAAAIAAIAAQVPAGKRHLLAGVGLATPSSIANNIVSAGAPAEQVPLWRALDLRAEIEAATSLPTIWLNNGNAACFAAMLFTAPPRPPNMVHLFVSTFLGAGMTANHALWEGPTGNAGNLGSMLVCDRDGKRRTAADIASARGLARALAAAGIELPSGNPANWPWQDWEPHVAAWLDAAGLALAQVLFNTGAVLEYDRAIIDSAFPAPIVARLVQATEAGLDQLAEFHPRRPIVAAGTLGTRAAPLGAAQMQLFRKYLSRDLADMLGEAV
jgi:predicted NBD/HSP70 family sugar kinase